MNTSLASTFGLTEPGALPVTGGTVQRVYDDLRRRIITLELPPDTTLSRADLTEAYEVSQTPIREAMQLLAQEGRCASTRRRTVGSCIDVQQIGEAHFLRVALETEVCRRRRSRATRRPYPASRSSVSRRPSPTSPSSWRCSRSSTRSSTRRCSPASSAAACTSGARAPGQASASGAALEEGKIAASSPATTPSSRPSPPATRPPPSRGDPRPPEQDRRQARGAPPGVPALFRLKPTRSCLRRADPVPLP